MTCPLCGTQIPTSRRRYCPHCGERLIKRPRRRALAPVLLALAVAAALIAVLIPRRPPAPTPRERFLAANREAVEPVLELLGGGERLVRLTVTGDLPGRSLSAILRLASVTADCAVTPEGLTAALTFRILGAAALTGTVTYADGLVGVYIPELDGEYYRFDPSALADIPSAGDAARYVGLALDLVTDENLELTSDDGTDTFICRPDIYEGLTWTLTEREGVTQTVALSVPGYELTADFTEREEKTTLTLTTPDFTVSVRIDAEAPPEAPKAPDKTPVLVPDEEIPALFQKLTGGIKDVL